ncbi:MAG: hypothetical protein KDD60_09640, partial [Bdellovibrionales bacterium]|nr:hypothetical protein [Bdellovibrionales bacterium]
MDTSEIPAESLTGSLQSQKSSPDGSEQNHAVSATSPSGQTDAATSPPTDTLLKQFVLDLQKFVPEQVRYHHLRLTKDGLFIDGDSLTQIFQAFRTWYGEY